MTIDWKITRPKFFCVSLQRCGFDSSNRNIGKLTDKNVEKLLLNTVNTIANEIVGDDLSPRLLFTLALDIIDQVYLGDKETDIKKEMAILKESIEKYTIIEA